jgi:hypothetical protein
MRGLKLEEGRWPWEPSGEARLLQVLDQFNVPTEGFLEEEGNVYLFRCIDGHADPLSLWIYAPVPKRHPDLRESHDDSAWVTLIGASAVSFALVDSDRGIVRIAEKIDHSSYPSLLHAAVDSLGLSAEEQATIGIEERETLSP